MTRLVASMTRSTISAAVLLGLCGVGAVSAHADPSYPLFCQGFLANDPESKVEFQWGNEGAGTAKPGSLPKANQCEWADRAPRGDEGMPGSWSQITGLVVTMQPGRFYKICVQGVGRQMKSVVWQGQVDPSEITPAPVGCPTE